MQAPLRFPPYNTKGEENPFPVSLGTVAGP
jgi:hypothetical protein